MPRRAWLIVSSSYCQSCYVKNGNEPQTSSSSSLPSSPSSPSFALLFSSPILFIDHFVYPFLPSFLSSFYPIRYPILRIILYSLFSFASSSISSSLFRYFTISSYSLLVLHSRRPHYRPPFHSRRRRDRVNVSERTAIAPFKRALSWPTCISECYRRVL